MPLSRGVPSPRGLLVSTFLRVLSFCTIGHTAGRGPRQRTCCVAVVHERARNQSPPTRYRGVKIHVTHIAPVGARRPNTPTTPKSAAQPSPTAGVKPPQSATCNSSAPYVEYPHLVAHNFAIDLLRVPENGQLLDARLIGREEEWNA